ncbi:MAG TPA: hypothetical protein VHE55_04965 [Fimbriimonadaceae bacterium]|nr:hypothetical protein [Fimbriimonadaceae bacterium]
MVAGICALLFAAARITFHEPAMRVEPLLAKLSKACGVPMKASADVGRLVAYVSVDDVDVHALMDRLADALDAKWKEDAGFSVLVSSPEKEKAELQTAHQVRRKQIEDVLGSAFKSLSATFDNSAAKALVGRLIALKTARDANLADENTRREYDAANNDGPTHRLILKLLKTIPIEKLASMQPGQREIYSLNPTKLQNPFGAGGRQAIEDFLREQRLFSEALAEAHAPANSGRETVSEALSWPDPIEAAPDDFYMAIGIAYNDDLSCNLLLRGQTIPRTISQFFGRAPSDAALYQIASEPGPKGEQPISLSPESAELIKLAKGTFGRNGKGHVVPSPSLLSLLEHPVDFDPLAFAASDALKALAEDGHKNMVAWVPDSAFILTLYPSMGTRALSLDLVRRLLGASSQGMDSAIEGSWLVMKPHNPNRARQEIDDRAAIGNLVQASVKGKALLLPYAQYAASSGHGPYDGLGVAYMFLVDPSSGSMTDGSNWGALKLYGSFDAQRRAALERGEQFAFRSLTPKQKEIVKFVTFGQLINNAVYDNPNMSRIAAKQAEPTEVLTDWVPDDCLVAMQVQRRQVLFGYDRDTNGEMKPSRTIDPNTIGWFLYAKEHPKPGENVPLPPDAYAVGEQALFHLRLIYGPKLWNELLLTENTPPSDKPVSWTDLPDEFKKSIEKALQRQADNDSRNNGGPPPPRN